MYLFFQLLTRNQGATALDLLHLLRPPLVPHKARLSVQARSQGTVSIQSLPKISELLTMYRERPFNEIEISCQTPPCGSGESSMVVKSMRALLRLSPTNSCWAATKRWPAGRAVTVAGEFFLRHGQESFLIWQNILALPTSIEVCLEMETPRAEHPSCEEIVAWLKRSMPEELVSEEIFGSVDNCGRPGVNATAGDGLWAQFSTMKSLAFWPGAFGLLGHRFDALHEFVLNRTALCQDLARELSIGPPVNLSEDDAPGCLSVLHIPSEFKNVAATRCDLVVPRDQTTAMRKADPKRGEFEFNNGSNIYFTRKRYEELDRAGFHLPVGPSQCLLSFVSGEHCAQLNVNPDDMLVFVGDRVYGEMLKRKIDSALRVLPESMDACRRLWEAYSSVWKSFGQPPEMIRFMRDRFFPSESSDTKA